MSKPFVLNEITKEEAGSSKVDVSIAFYGKPHHTIIAIKSLIEHCGEHIDTIYLARERVQPHNDYIGIYKVIDYFRNTGVNLSVYYPRYFIPVGLSDYERTKSDSRFRHSIMFQYPLEITDKEYLVVMHNDMLFHRNIVGEMIKLIKESPQHTIGVGSVGQCWSCPAGPNWGNKCNSNRYEHYVPSLEEAIELTEKYETPRRDIQLKVLKEGRVHLLPECRLNEYCALIDVQKYRKETLPHGDLGCYGGSWGGVDLGTVWSHEIYKRGYKFIAFPIDDYAKHSPFDSSGSGTKSKTHLEVYQDAEQNAKKYLEENYGPLQKSLYITWAFGLDTVKRAAWRLAIAVYVSIKKFTKKN